MAEALGLASSLVALTGFAFQASKSLYQVLESFKSTKRTVRELRHELDALNQVIEALQKVAVDHEKDLSTLKLPLLRCGKTCKEFEDVIEKCAPRSDVQRPRFIEWARLQYMGGDISNLKATLSGYKATISIALGGATL
jgi:chromosome segregation ATPase